MALILKVAVPAPLRTLFDYLPPEGCNRSQLKPGIRIQVPFGKKIQTGLLVAIENISNIDPEKLRPALSLLDCQPLLPKTDLELLTWAAQYYQHPVGEAFAAAMPALLRQGKPAAIQHTPNHLVVTQLGIEVSMEQFKHAPRQGALMARLQQQGAIAIAALKDLPWDWRAPAKALIAKGLVEFSEAPDPENTPQTNHHPLSLNSAQDHAVSTITQHLRHFTAFLLEGVTGSGKTEVYLRVIQQILASNRQVLMLFPEIALTPQLQRRLQTGLNQPVAVYHSGLSPGERLNAWLRFKEGKIPILLGTRSAVFVPMARPGLIILDEEHDPSFKQQEGFRFSARDVAVVKAQKLDIPIVMGSATPSLESLNNARTGRYHHLRLPTRAGNARLPNMKRVDLRNQKLEAGMAASTKTAVLEALNHRQQVLLFLNRRGYAPALLCHSCGWIATCHHCDAKTVVHREEKLLLCHHCGQQQPLPSHCPACQSGQLQPLGQGTERIESELNRLFPNARIARIDRDTTRRKGRLESHFEAAREGQIDILIGTQMLAKGHHFPNVTLVVILDADSGLYSTDFRSEEHLAQLIVQVAGRAGRARKPGTVLIQTHLPDHPLLCCLLEEGYSGFAGRALNERKQAQLPPFSHLAMLRAESIEPERAEDFLLAAAKIGKDLPTSDTQLFGPAAAPMPKRAGRYRSQLLVHNHSRRALQKFLTRWLPPLTRLPQARQVRWSLDVDPITLY